MGCNCRIIDGDIVRAFYPGPYRVFHLCHVFERISKYTEVPLVHYQRKYGKSGWTVWKMADLFVDNLIGYIRRPFLILGILLCLFMPLFVTLCTLLFLTSSPFSQIWFQSTVFFFFGLVSITLLLLLSAIGELAIRTHGVLMHKPVYICKTVMIRERYQ